MSAVIDAVLLGRLNRAIMARANRGELLAVHDDLAARLAGYRGVLTVAQADQLSRVTCPACVPGFAGVTVDGDGVAMPCARCAARAST